MPIALTCDCGARFEVDKMLAAQEVHCPECKQKHRAPHTADSTLPVCPMALYALVLAIAGAFTLVGAVASVVVSLLAMGQIRNSKSPMQGFSYAVAALIIAGVGSVITLGVLLLPGGTSWAGWFRARSIAGQLDNTVPNDISSRDGICRFTRPTGWGRLQADRGFDATIDTLQTKRDILLCSSTGDAYIDVRRDPSTADNLSIFEQDLRSELAVAPPSLFEGDNAPHQSSHVQVIFRHKTNLDPVDKYEAVEWIVDIRRGGQPWRFMIRAYQRENKGAIYIVRAYAPLSRFTFFEPILRAALDSVHFPS